MLTGPGEVESSRNSENALGIGVWLMEMDLGSSGGERRRVTSSATRFTSCFDKSGGREGVCGSTEAALELGEDLSVSLPGDEIWFSRVGCEPARLVFLRGCSPPAAIATASAEGVRKRFVRLGGILSLRRKWEKTTR